MTQENGIIFIDYICDSPLRKFRGVAECLFNHRVREEILACILEEIKNSGEDVERKEFDTYAGLVDWPKGTRAILWS